MKNKGYSFIELMIVLAIMAVLSACAFLTIGIINNAKRDSGITTFESQLENLLVKTKAMSKTDEKLSMVIKKDTDNKWSFYYGTYDASNNFTPLDQDASGNWIKEASLPSNLDIVYVGSNLHPVATSDVIVITYRKADGTVLYGSGEYEFSFRGTVVAKVNLDKDTGNHYRVKEASK